MEVKEKNTDVMVDHPAHYKSNSGLEAIDVIEAFTADLSGSEAVCAGNVLKYMCRWPHKNGLQDLKKARWYLDRLISNVEKGVLKHNRSEQATMDKMANCRIEAIDCHNTIKKEND